MVGCSDLVMVTVVVLCPNSLSRYTCTDLARDNQKHKSTMKWQRPHAGTIAFPRLELEIEVDEFCDELRKESGVLLLPASVYSPTSKMVIIF